MSPTTEQPSEILGIELAPAPNTRLPGGLFPPGNQVARRGKGKARRSAISQKKLNDLMEQAADGKCKQPVEVLWDLMQMPEPPPDMTLAEKIAWWDAHANDRKLAERAASTLMKYIMPTLQSIDHTIKTGDDTEDVGDTEHRVNLRAALIELRGAVPKRIADAE
jgi:hypothetical protein